MGRRMKSADVVNKRLCLGHRFLSDPLIGWNCVIVEIRNADLGSSAHVQCSYALSPRLVEKAKEAQALRAAYEESNSTLGH